MTLGWYEKKIQLIETGKLVHLGDSPEVWSNIYYLDFHLTDISKHYFHTEYSQNHLQLEISSIYELDFSIFHAIE